MKKKHKQKVDKTKQWIVNQFLYGKLDATDKKMRDFWASLIKGFGLENKLRGLK